MDDDDVRAPLLSRGTKIAAAVTVAGLLIVFVVLPRYVRYRDHKEAVEQEATEAPYRNEQAALEQQLAARLGPLATIGHDAPEQCPPAVTGALPVVQREWLTYALSHDAYPDAPQLSSPAMLYWANVWTPSGTDSLAKKSQAERELLAAPHVALFTTAAADPIKRTGDVTFEGGGVAGELLVVDVAAKSAVCRAEIRVQPGFVVAVKQDSADGDRYAMQSAERDAIRDAFWTGVEAQLARMAPGAHPVKER